MTKTNIILVALCFTTIALSGCSNTFEGAGRDLQRSGEWLQDTF